MAGPVYTAGRYPLTDGLSGGGVLQAPTVPAVRPLVASGIRIPARTGVAQPDIKVDSLVDDFTTADSSKWTYFGTAGVSAGQLQLVPDTAYDNKIDSLVTYDLTSSQISVQVVSAPVGNGGINTYLKCWVSGGDEIFFVTESGLLYMIERVSGVDDSSNITYSPTSHLWWRLRHDGVNVYWETSPDGSTWTVQKTKVAGRLWNAVTAQLLSGYFGTEPTPGVSTFDNLNVGGQPASANADVAAGVGAAFDATVQVSSAADVAAGSGAASDAVPAVAVNAGVAAGTGSAANGRVAHTYYVDPAGSDSADGYTTGTAWATIGKVNAASLGAGDVVLFKRGGTWTGTELTVAGSGQAGSPILIGAYGSGALPIFDGGGTDTTVGTVIPIRLTGNWVTVDSVQVQHSLETGLLLQGNDLECRNFVATHNPVGVGSSANTARHQLHDFQCIDNNIEVVGAGSNDDYGAIGVSLSGDSEEVYNFLVSGSLTFSSPDYGTDGSMVEIFGATNCLIRDGVGIDCETFTEMGDASTTNVVFRNIVYRSSFSAASGVNIQGTGTFGPVTGVTVENCTIQLTGASSQGLIVNPGAQCLFKNNIVQAAYFGWTPDPQDEEHNLWFGGANGNDVTSTHHATQSGLAPTDVIADPLWVDPASGDLHLGNDSPAINLGVTVAWTTDLDGNPRTVGAAPDAGAYEWQGPLAPAGTGTGSALSPSVSAGAAPDTPGGTGSASDAVPAVATNAGQPGSTGQAFDATVATATATNANADFAAAAGVASDAAVAVAVNADIAAATGSGLDAAGAVGASAGQPAGAAVASDAAVEADAAAGVGTAAGAAFDAAPSLAVAPAADVALAAGGGLDAATAAAVTAGQATGSGTAFDAVVDAGVPAAVAAGVGAAFDAGVALASAPTAEVAAATGTGWDAAAAAGGNADIGVGVGACFDAAVDAAVSAGQPSGSGTGFDAGADCAAVAGTGSGAGAAFDAATVLAAFPQADVAAATGTGNNATVTTSSTTNAPADVSAGAGAGADAAVAVTVSADIGLGSGTAFDAAADVGGSPAVTAGSGSAYDAFAACGPAAEAGSATGVAGDASGSAGAQPGAAPAAGTAGDGASAVSALADFPATAGTAFDAIVQTASDGTAAADVAAGSAIAADATAAVDAVSDLPVGSATGWDGAALIGAGPDWTAAAGAAFDAVVVVDGGAVQAAAGVASAAGAAYLASVAGPVTLVVPAVILRPGSTRPLIRPGSSPRR